MRGSPQVLARKNEILDFCKVNRRRPSRFNSDPEESRLSKLAQNYTSKSAHSYDIDFVEKYRSYPTLLSQEPERLCTRTYNKNFFKVPNVLNCYWAGFIAADGCISDKYNSFHIALAEKDKEHLDLFAKTIDYSGNLLYFRKTKAFSLQLYSSHQISLDLENLFNITENKSLTLRPPRGLELYNNDIFLKSFLIGFIDGDGCIKYCERDKSIIVDFSGASLFFIKWIKYFLENEYDLPSKKIYTANSSIRPFYTYRLQGKNAFLVLKDLDAINVPKLRRKWDKLSLYPKY